MADGMILTALIYTDLLVTLMFLNQALQMLTLIRKELQFSEKPMMDQFQSPKVMLKRYSEHHGSITGYLDKWKLQHGADKRRMHLMDYLLQLTHNQHLGSN